MEDTAKKYFSPKVSNRDRAVFEAGIAIGMAIHQFTGIPIRFREEVKLLEKVIEYAIMSQPFKKEAHVKLNIDVEENQKNPYSYHTLKSRNMDITVTVEYGDTIVKAKLKYVPELDYSLAYIEDIIEKSRDSEVH
ncbi:MAG: dihydroneopterin aldolase family protein [Ignisphaera sp.]|uniref:Dihydroneopterin aldolase n=1 Tax=Ignisphaera aggregans TaxID=334771 RepID=A0A7J3MZR7_9CREN